MGFKGIELFPSHMLRAFKAKSMGQGDPLMQGNPFNLSLSWPELSSIFCSVLTEKQFFWKLQDPGAGLVFRPPRTPLSVGH